MPERIQRKRTKGWHMPPGAVYVGRGTKWGNPFIGTRQELKTVILPAYREWLVAQMEGRAARTSSMFGVYAPPVCRRLDLTELRGKDLACWCPLTDKRGKHVHCHADVLLELANK